MSLLAAPAVHAGDLLPFAAGATRGGIPVVAVQGGPWAVVSLHARIAAGDLTPVERRSLEALGRALADGQVGLARPISADASDAGGRVRFRVDPDHLVVSYGAPADRLAVLLKALDTTLKDRGRLLPAVGAPEALPATDPEIDPAALALAAAGHPLALPTSGGAPDGPAVRALADKVLRRDRIAVSVVGPQAPADLLAAAQKALTTVLAAAPASPPLPLVLDDGIALRERRDGDAAGSSSTVWLLSPGRGSPGAAPADRAARSVLARLAGGTSEGCDALFGVAFAVTSERASRIARAEAVPMTNLEAVATTPPPAEAVEAARTAERAARLARLKDADAVADALGRSLLAGDAGLVEAEIDAVAQVTPADVAAAARALASGPRVVVRTLGASRPQARR